MEEEEYEKREEEERRERRKQKEKEKKLRRKEKLKSKEKGNRKNFTPATLDSDGCLTASLLGKVCFRFIEGFAFLGSIWLRNS